MQYHFAPDRSPTGLEYYERKVRDLIAKLGSTHNVALGASAGACAALYFGARCQLDQIIAFSPALFPEEYISMRAHLRAFSDVKSLILRPKAYLEVATIALGARFLLGRYAKAIGETNTWDVPTTFCNSTERPPTTIFYGAYCRPDRRQARMLDGLDNVKFVEIPTGHHNSPAYLHQQDLLGQTIVDEIRQTIAASATSRANT